MLGLGLISLLVGLGAGFIAARIAGERRTPLQNLAKRAAGAFLGGGLFWMRATRLVGALVVETVGSVLLLGLLDRRRRPRA